MSDTLIDTVKRLADLEPKATPEWKSASVINKQHERKIAIYQDPMYPFGEFNDDENGELAVALRNAAPKLLDVLCQFQAGDAAQIATIMRQMQSWYGEDRTPGYEERMKLLARMQNMASLMEAAE